MIAYENAVEIGYIFQIFLYLGVGKRLPAKVREIFLAFFEYVHPRRVPKPRIPLF
jgi:hypothetical protein